jgi:hypothetical protein
MKHFSALFPLLFFSVSAMPQDVGTIRCKPGSSTKVPAWSAPARPFVVEQLSCGQMVGILGRQNFIPLPGYSSHPSEYVKIKLGDKVAFVDAQYVGVSEVQRLPERAATEQVPVERPISLEEGRSKWNLIASEKVNLRDEILLDPVYMDGPRFFKATLSNNSEIPMSQLSLLVRLYDCSGKPKSDHANCEIIGEVKPIVPASIPPGQTRLVTASLQFEATPRVRVTFAWGYWVLGVRAQ